MADKPGSVAIIGAGISGLTCARALLDRKVAVTVFDKGRTVGGRASAKQTQSGSYDFGAQYFTVRDPRFQSQVDQWLHDGAVDLWQGQFAVLDQGNLTPSTDSVSRYVGTPDMQELCRRLAKSVPTQQSIHVAPPERTSSGWKLQAKSGQDLGTFDIVLISAPPEQAASLAKANPDLVAKATAVRAKACWAVMVAFDMSLSLPVSGAFVHNSDLSWISNEGDKPGRIDTSERWVLHGSADWSETHLEDKPEEVTQQLLAAFWQATGLDRREPVFSQAHRWRHAIVPEPTNDGCYFDAGQQIGLCGDWCHGARVEGAYLSGLALAEKV